MHPLIAIPATLALVYRAWSRQSLTPAGIAVAALTAVIHAIHPWSVFFALLVVFFLSGTAVTKVKHEVKARLTQSSSGASGGDSARTHVQVLANSVVASVLILVHSWRVSGQQKEKYYATKRDCWGGSGDAGADLLVVGIVSNYAAVAADTFSSELGILSTSKPRLLTSWTFRKVPPGTNGGVTLTGLLAGFAGSCIIALTTVILLPFCKPSTMFLGKDTSPSYESLQSRVTVLAFVTIWGGLGSLLDSALGGWLQASVVDRKTGKIVEGSGGRKVLIEGSRTPSNKKSDDHSRFIESGLSVLDNNAVNLLMAALMSVGGMFIMSLVWQVPFSIVLYHDR